MAESIASVSDLSSTADLSSLPSTTSSFVLTDAMTQSASIDSDYHDDDDGHDGHDGHDDHHHQDDDTIDDDDDEAAELDSLPSISTSVLSPSDAGSSLSDAQHEWEASLEQLQLMLTMVLVPFVGKFLGRKVAYWSWTRYMDWAHGGGVDIRVTDKKAFAGAGAVAASTL